MMLQFSNITTGCDFSHKNQLFIFDTFPKYSNLEQL